MIEITNRRSDDGYRSERALCSHATSRLRAILAASLLRALATLFAAGVVLVAGVSTGGAYTEKVLYDFCGVPDCTNGAEPEGPLLRDPSGNIFGTVMDGAGSAGGGGVYELTPSGDTWTEQVIYALCTASACPYGAAPSNGVIMDTTGNLYGTTSYAGINNAGTVFELIPNKSKTKWKAKLLFAFCSDGTCADGYIPNALTYSGQAGGALYDGSSPLYGTTIEGGASNGGVAFALTPPAPGKKKWKEKVIHVFCSPNTSDGCTSDGATPKAGMIMDAAGNLYGTTSVAGQHDAGNAFELKPKRNSWTEKVLHDFCSQPSCADGGGPEAPLLLDAAGNLLGTGGTVFKLDPKTLEFTVLHSGGDGTDWTLVMDAQRNLYAASFSSFANDFGSVWALNPNYEVLYSFCPVVGCKDGGFASSPPLLDATGNLIGTTLEYGAHGAGVVYELTP
jgi:hypothetical protein